MSRKRIRIEDFTPPSKREVALATRGSRWYFSPHFEGLEHIDPNKPALYVGNHTIYGVIDVGLLVDAMYRQCGVYPRSLGDHAHFDLPGWGEMALKAGAVPGTRENCRALMQSGQHIIVFPGGAREVAKRKDEINRLTWKSRTGFARMAIENGYDIIPFASAGCDKSYKILFDGHDFNASRLGKWMLKHKRFNEITRNGDLIMPVARGIGPTNLPRPEPFWFGIGERISTRELVGQEDNKDTLWALRNRVSGAIETMLEDLEARRQLARRSWLRLLLLKL